MTSNVRTWMLAVGGSLIAHAAALAALTSALAGLHSHAPVIELPSGSGSEIQVSLAAVEEIATAEPVEPPVVAVNEMESPQDLPEQVAVSDVVIVRDSSLSEEPSS